MKATVDLPDELFKELKIRAATEGRKLKDVMAEAIRRGLASGGHETGNVAARVSLPLVRCAHPAGPETEMTPGRIAALLLAEEAQGPAGL